MYLLNVINIYQLHVKHKQCLNFTTGLSYQNNAIPLFLANVQTGFKLRERIRLMKEFQQDRQNLVSASCIIPVIHKQKTYLSHFSSVTNYC